MLDSQFIKKENETSAFYNATQNASTPPVCERTGGLLWAPWGQIQCKLLERGGQGLHDQLSRLFCLSRVSFWRSTDELTTQARLCLMLGARGCLVKGLCFHGGHLLIFSLVAFPWNTNPKEDGLRFRPYFVLIRPNGRWHSLERVFLCISEIVFPSPFSAARTQALEPSEAGRPAGLSFRTQDLETLEGGKAN